MGGMSQEEWNKRLEAEHNRRNAEEFRALHDLDQDHNDDPNRGQDPEDLERHLKDVLMYTDCFASSLIPADAMGRRFQRTFSDNVKPLSLHCCNHCIN